MMAEDADADDADDDADDEEDDDDDSSICKYSSITDSVCLTCTDLNEFNDSDNQLCSVSI